MLEHLEDLILRGVDPDATKELLPGLDDFDSCHSREVLLCYSVEASDQAMIMFQVN